jgi:hypothetical protein
MNDTGNHERQAPEQEKQGKKPYQKPAFQYERVFETAALRCGKMGPTQNQCKFNKKTS